MSNIFIAIKLLSASIQAALGKHFGIKSQKGVALMEYALLGALIAVVAVATLGEVGTAIDAVLTRIETELDLS